LVPWTDLEAGAAHRTNPAPVSPSETEGLSNADAGERIHVSEATVKTYVSRILTKLRCENRVQAALLARDAGLGPG
ncbi:response regulator transcription factor, partial [Streptomyces prunicolor]|uniref:response regulator transcription factor n=1 Tax=Streptomyces prunicolor TaxID=67348 RepID=UPI0033FCCC49